MHFILQQSELIDYDNRAMDAMKHLEAQITQENSDYFKFLKINCRNSKNLRRIIVSISFIQKRMEVLML